MYTFESNPESTIAFYDVPTPYSDFEGWKPLFEEIERFVNKSTKKIKSLVSKKKSLKTPEEVISKEACYAEVQ
jgi:ferritin